MSFLFPLYLLGATAIAVPILLHLRRRPPKEHVEFGSLMFLEKTPERVTRRTQLEQLLLLALRCLAILLLAFAFGRPFLDSVRLPSEDSSLTRAVILVDRSASMRREGLRETAAKAAREAAERYGAGAEVALAFFDERFDLAADLPALAGLGPGARSSAVEALLAEEKFQPSWLGTDLGAAMKGLHDLIRKRSLVILLSDLLAPIEELEKQIGYFAAGRHEIAVFQFLDPRELDFDFVKATHFRDKESQKAGYLQRLNAHLEAIRKICSRHGTTYRLVRTDEPLEQVLFEFVNLRRG